MSGISDNDEAELWVIENALKERFGKPIDIEFADADVRLDPADKNLTTCPTAYREARGARLIIFKSNESRYRAQFFYSVREQYGTGMEEFDDLTDCAVTLLRVQADHERQKGLAAEAADSAQPQP